MLGRIIEMKRILIFALAIFAGPLFAADNSTPQPVANPQPILQKLQQKMSSLHSVCFHFTQERHLKLFSEPLKSEGVMFIDQPDQIRWETTAPYQSILMGNHKSVAQFEETDGKWEKLKPGIPQLLRRVMDQMVLMNQGKLDALTSDYTISVATNASATVFTLVPKDENVRAILSSLEVKMQPDLSTMQEIILREPGGDFTRIIFTKELRGVTFPLDTFDQNKPLEVAAVQKAIGDAP
jgi:outer membrane lipoprotein-sorting protein